MYATLPVFFSVFNMIRHLYETRLCLRTSMCGSPCLRGECVCVCVCNMFGAVSAIEIMMKTGDAIPGHAPMCACVYACVWTRAHVLRCTYECVNMYEHGSIRFVTKL